MDTTIYFFAGYVAFWLLPTLYIFQILKKLDRLEKTETHPSRPIK